MRRLHFFHEAAGLVLGGAAIAMGVYEREWFLSALGVSLIPGALLELWKGVKR